MSEWVCACCELPPSRHTTRRGRAAICLECRGMLAERGLGWCTRGAHRVPLADLTGNHGVWCRACAQAARRADYARHRERELAQARAQYARDPARHRARARDWEARHPERRRLARRLAARRWRATWSPERLAAHRAYNRAYHWRHRDRALLRMRRGRARAALKALWGTK